MRKSRPKGSLTQDYTAAGPVPDSVLYSLFDTAQVDYLPTGFPCILALSNSLDHGIPNSAGLELAIAEGTAYESLHIII